MLSVRSIFCAFSAFLFLPVVGFSQPGSSPASAYFVQDKIASSDQGLELEFGTTLAMGGDIMVASDENEHVEILRRNPDGSWALEAVLSAPDAGTDFGTGGFSLATNGEWVAVGAQGDDTFGTNAGAVHLYRYDGLDWQYEGKLSHMAPFGSIGYDNFGMSVAMDGDRMVMGSKAENGAGAKGAIHYFQYNAMLDMWLETGFIASTHTTGSSTTRFALSIDISGDYLIAGEYGNPDNGALAGAAHIYKFYNQCWHLEMTFLGHAAGDRLGTDVSISGNRAVAGSPNASMNGDTQGGGVTVYELLPYSGGGMVWSETWHFAPDAVGSWDAFGGSLDLDGELLVVGSTKDDEGGTNAGIGYFIFDCSTATLECVSEGLACDASNNDRFGADVATSGGLAAIGSRQDDNIFEDAGSVYVLGADDLGFECDLTPPGAPETDLVDEDDTGASAEDDTTRQTTPDFDVFLPGGGSLSVTSDYMAEAGDALVFYMEGSGDSTIVILTEDDIDNGVVHFEFVYPGPVLEDGTYTFCSYLIDVFGNVGETDCQTILIDNSDPVPSIDFGTSAIAGSDTTLYLDDNGNISLDISNVANISASDNIGMDTLYVDITEFDCADAGSIVTVTLTAVDIAGNIAITTFGVAIQDEIDPIALTQDITVQLDALGSTSITPAQIDNGSNDACGIAGTTLDITSFSCADVGANTVTLTVTDNNGNSSSATATVTVEDNELPTVTAQDLTLQLDATGNASTTAAAVNNGSSDACGILSLSLSQTNFTCADVGANTVILTGTDNNGNSATATATITVEDNVLPVVLAQDLTVQLDASGNGSITAAQVDNGSSDACGIDTLYLDVYDFDCDDQGANTVTLTVVDNNGNSNTATATVTVQDLVDPIATTQDITVQLDASGAASITPAQVDNGSDDTCGGIASMTVAPDSFDCANLGANTVTLTVYDGSGNSATATATVTVQDMIAPTLTGTPSNISQSNDAGVCGAAVSWTDPTASDNCNATLSSTHNSGDTFAVGTTTVTFTAADVSGNTTTSTFTVTVTDNEAPAISGMPADITQTADAGECEADVNWTAPTAADNCSIATFTSDYNSGAAFPVGTTTVTYTATDIHSNTTTATFTVTVTDDEQPAISGTPANITQTADAGECEADVTWTAPTAADNCGIASFTSDANPGDAFPVGTTTVTYTATDIHSNTITSTFTVTVTDDEAPAIAGMPANITQSTDAGLCTATVNWTAPTGSDNCGLATLTADANSGDAFSIGTTTVTYTATDIHGNTTTATFTVTVEENEDPTISGMPSNITLSNDAGICGAAATWTEPTAADNCGIASFSPTHANGSTFAVGTTTVTYTATDLAGNTTTATFSVTVTDDEAPVIGGVPGNINLNNDPGNCSAVANWTDATATDNCGIATITSDYNSGDAFPVGSTTTVTFTATDIHSNTTTATFTVTVTDNEQPTISGMPANITQTADAGECEADVTWTAPTAADNCGIATFSADANSGDAFPVGTTTVTYTATDIHGNSATGSFTITVTDDEAPAISGIPANISQSNDAGDCSAAVSWTAPTASDNCGITSLTTTHANGSVFAVGTTTVTYTALDIHGNTTTSSFTVTVTDDEDPSITGTPANISLNNDAGNCTAVASWAAATAADNCGIASFTSDYNSGAAFPVGMTTVTYTATDIHSNTTTSTFTVTVTDNEQPTISGMPANISLNNDAGNCTAVANWTAPTAADNCGIATFTSDYNSGAAFPVGTTTVTYTATDIHSNTSTATFTVTVTDNEQPTISGMPANITQTADAGECEADVTWTAPTAADNCAIATFTSDANPGDAFAVGTTTVTYTATDIHGNSSTGSFTITVTDDEDPAISGMPANITQSNDAGNCSAAVSWTAPTASDNCGVASLTTTHAIGSVFAVGTTTVTYTATDIHGNTSTGSFTVTVNDDEDPIISPMAMDQTYQRDGGEAAAFAAWLANNGGAAATDNCGLSGWSNNSTGLSDGCGSTGTETVTFTATDIHSNTSTTSATFTVIDDFAPSCPLIDLVYANDDGPSQEDNVTNDPSPTVRVMFTGSGVESAEAGDVVELYIMGVLSQTHTVTEADVTNGYASFETGPFADGPVMFSARHIDDCGQASIFAFLNVIINTAAPELEVQPVTVSLDEFGMAVVPIEDFVVSATDDFGPVFLSVGGNPELYVVEDDDGNLILLDLENQEAEFIDIDPVHDVLNGYAQIMMYDAAAGGFLFTDGYSNYAVTNDAFEVLYTGALDDGSFADGDINLDCVHAVDQAGGWIYAIERSDCAVADSLRFFRFRFDGIGEIEAELLHTLASDVNGNTHDFESMAVDLEGGIAYLVGDHDLYGGSSSQELWMLVMSTGQLVYLGELDNDTEAMWFDDGQLWLGQDNGEVGLPQFEELPAATPYVCNDPSCAIPGTVQFVKDDYADTDDSALWDHITDNVALFRSNNGGLYNALSGGGIYYKRGATGSAGAYISDFGEVNDYNANDLPGDTLSLYIPEGDLCFDLVFSSWTCCGDGGGFAYERIHVPTPSILVGGILGSSEYLDLDDFNGSYNTNDIQAAYFGRVFTQSVMLDCNDTDAPVEVVVRAEDIAGNVTFDTTYATVIDDLAPTLVLEPHTVYLSDAGEGYFNVSDVLGDATMDNCSYVAEMTWDGQGCGAAPKYGLTAGTLDANTSNCDDCTSLVPLGFDFTFYGETYSQVYISSNGLLQFESSSSECCDGEAIPDSDYEAAIAVIHTDLDPAERDDANIYYQTVGTAPNREFVVSWSQVSNYEDNDVRHDGQAVLYEATGQVDIFSGYHAYLPDDCDDPMTTGISNQDGTLGMAPQQFVENCSERGNLYIEFTPDGDNYAMEYEVCSDFTCSDVGVVEVAVTLTDPSGNATSGTVEVTVVDEVAPLVVSTPYVQPLDENGEATYDLSNAVATDACGIQSFVALNTLDCEVDAPEMGTVDFQKPDNTSGPEATDVIGWDVALTRGNSGGLYNALTQNSYNQAGPDGTLWKLGAADSENQWTSLYDAVDGSLGNNLVGTTLTMVTLQSQRFFEVAFTSWSCCGDGGFAYTRTEVPTASGLFSELEPGTGCDGFVSETVSFEKMDYDDPSLVHDSIAPGVWISRGDDQGLINAATGESWDGEGPSGTLWRVAGSGGAWSSFYDVFGGGIGNAILSTELELWVPSVNQVWHMDFTSWTQGGNGGGFAYTRTSLAPCAGCTNPVALDYDPDALFATPCDIPVYEEVELVATDVNGNVTHAIAYMAVVDEIAPEVNIFDLDDYTMYAGESCVNMVDLFAAGAPWYEATDNCDVNVEILYDEINETGIAGCREFDRRWIILAEDQFGNTASDTTLQHITVIDTTAPAVFLDGVPADLSIELDANCNAEMPAEAAVTASATDNCTDAPSVSAVTYTDSDPTALCDGGGSYSVTRTYTATATDDCGNTGMATATQVVTFLDVTAPQITDSEGILNGETLTQEEASGVFDFITLPSEADLEAEDGCSDVTIEVTETIGGFAPTDEIGNYCSASTPEAFLDGNACSGDAPAAIVLEGAPFNGAAFSIVPYGINIIESHYDQSLSIEIVVENADGTGGFIWNADYNSALNWAEWSALGRGYKKDCADVLPGTSPWTQWKYLVMQTGGMIGTGIYAGSELSLTHQPMNYYYGLQIGNGANNQNANYGASAWFYWSGQLILDGVSQGYLGSSGDVMLDLECTLPWTVSYDYAVSDACGNTTTFGYSVTNAAAQGQDASASASGEGSGHQPFDVSVGGDLKEPIRVTGLMPNPTNNVSQLGFVVSNNMRLRVDLFDMNGQLIQELFDGNAMSDVEYFLTIDAQGLDAGMYQIRISSNTYMAVKKLLVSQ